MASAAARAPAQSLFSASALASARDCSSACFSSGAYFMATSLSVRTVDSAVRSAVSAGVRSGFDVQARASRGSAASARRGFMAAILSRERIAI